MKSISFDNPLFLLIAIPLLLLTFIPYFLAIKKDNKSAGSTTSLILHILIIALVTLGLAGLTHTTVMTETEVYVVADISYSSNRNLDLIDEYISGIGSKLPEKSKVGVVTFGKDSELLVEAGGELVSVKDSKVDTSATDISSALRYTSTLFSESTVKRIVLISDGKQSANIEDGSFAAAVAELDAKNIFIDAVYIDNNINESTPEIQISDVDYVKSTYLGNTTRLTAVVESGKKVQSIITLYKNGVRYLSQPKSLESGYNTVYFDIETSEVGEVDYYVEVTSEEGNDSSTYNNKYLFTQTVNESLQVLLITDNDADEALAEAKYGDGAVIDRYNSRQQIPYTVEALAKYDEIIISDIDVRALKNSTSFVNALDAVVSRFGKSLLTLGDLNIQNRTDDNLSALENMLPLKYGNDAKDAKLYIIVLDVSMSMENAGRLKVAKQAAKKLIDLLKGEDSVAVVGFYGQAYTIFSTTDLSSKTEIFAEIDKITMGLQSTSIGAGLERAYEFAKKADNYDEKQVILLSDGVTDKDEKADPLEIAENLLTVGATTSTINLFRQDGIIKLQNIAAKGGGKYYYIEDEESVDATILDGIAGDITETVIEEESPVNVNMMRDDAVIGITSLPNIQGFIFSKAKSTVSTVLTTSYTKASGAVVNAPLYAYWKYGNGRVSSFTSSLSGEWCQSWTGADAQEFVGRMFSTQKPVERIDYPFTLNVEYDGLSAFIEILPVQLRYDATLKLTVTSPDGVETAEELRFNKTGYTMTVPTDSLGKYGIHIEYCPLGLEVFEADTNFSISYSPEYDTFATFSPAFLNTSISNKGTVSTDGVPEIENDEDRVATYKLDFSLPFMIIAIVLYVVDIIVRKLKWADVKSFFGKKRAKGG